MENLPDLLGMASIDEHKLNLFLTERGSQDLFELLWEQLLELSVVVFDREKEFFFFLVVAPVTDQMKNSWFIQR